MHVLVIGAGAWGLPAATRITERGHRVTLVDRWGPGNALSSSPGPSRIWRLVDHRPERVELSRYALEALERAERASGTTLFTHTGILWRHESSNDAAAAALDAVGAPATRVAANDVGNYFPGLRPSGSDAIWSDDAGTLFASEIIAAEQRRFHAAGGELIIGKHATTIVPDGMKPQVQFSDDTSIEADVVVVAAGMGAKALIDPLMHLIDGPPLPLTTSLQQVVHFGTADSLSHTGRLPCIFDGSTATEEGMYGMSTPGIGYKFGIDQPIRDFDVNDLDRTPSANHTALMTERIARDFDIPPTVVDAVCCNWTETADGEFVIDRLPGNVVVAAGDSGEGFKFTSIVGEALAALTLGEPSPIPLDRYRIDRFINTPTAGNRTPTRRRFGE